MAKDLHTLYDMLENAKVLASMNRRSEARDALVEMKMFYRDAELDGVPYEIVSSIVDEGNELLVEMFPNEFAEQSSINVKSFWRRLLGKKSY